MFGIDLDWRSCTKFTAIALAILNGATDIKIYGDDMSGKGYCDPGLENDRTQHDDKRWEMEKKTMEAIVLLALDRGIGIRRV